MWAKCLQAVCAHPLAETCINSPLYLFLKQTAFPSPRTMSDQFWFPQSLGQCLAHSSHSNICYKLDKRGPEKGVFLEPDKPIKSYGHFGKSEHSRPFSTVFSPGSTPFSRL